MDVNALLKDINSQKTSNLKISASKKAASKIIDFLEKNPNVSNKEFLKNSAHQIIMNLEIFKKSGHFQDLKISEVPDTVSQKKPKHNSDCPEYANKFSEVEIVGLESVKQALQDSIKLPLEHPELFTGNRKPAKMILLYGPPGTGKTAIVQSLQKFKVELICVSSSDIFSKYQGDSEKQIKLIFDSASSKKPCVIFIDEIDFLCKSRDSSDNDASNRVKSEFLVRTSELEHTDNIFLLGATNHPWNIDSAFLRRFQKKIYVGLPDFSMRKQLFKHFLSKNRNVFSESNYTDMANSTELFSTSDIKQIAQRMLCMAVSDLQNVSCFIKVDGKWKICERCIEGSKCRDQIGILKEKSFKNISDALEEPPVRMNHFYDALKRCKSSVKVEDLKRYDLWTEKYGER